MLGKRFLLKIATVRSLRRRHAFKRFDASAHPSTTHHICQAPTIAPTGPPTYYVSIDFVSVYKSSATGYQNNANSITVTGTALSTNNVTYSQYSLTTEFTGTVST